MEDNQLKQLHEVEMEILDEIVRLCKKYHLRYFLIHGTLLGAVRHQGFIPWDDDLDIAMPRDDYNRFIEVAQNELNSNYFLHSTQTDPNYWLSFAKVRKNNTLFMEEAVENLKFNTHLGIFVDIFPLDFVHKNQGLLLHIQSLISKVLIEAMYFKAGIYDETSVMIHPQLSKWVANLKMATLSKVQESVATWQNLHNSKYLGDFNTELPYLRTVYLSDKMLELSSMKYENREYYCPKDYDYFLKIVYGDYMKIPKKEDQKTHSVKNIDFSVINK